jgi:hypothetical protein
MEVIRSLTADKTVTLDTQLFDRAFVGDIITQAAIGQHFEHQ